MINDMKLIPFRNFYYRFIKANRYPISKKRILDKKVAEVKDIHNGETCFIIGNGPSLTISDLDAITECGYASFAANSIFKMFDKTKWRPTYLVFQDQQVIDGLVELFAELSKNCDKMFVRRDVYRQIDKKIIDSEKLILPRLVMKIRKDKYYDFSNKLETYAFDGCTVTYLMIQIAYYMGFKKIYLIGMDHNFPAMFDENDNVIVNNQIKQHCFEDSKHIILNPARVSETTYAYRSARRFLDNQGVEIYNATRGGKLEEFIRVNVDDILKDRIN